MTEIAKLIEADLSVSRRCYLFGTTPLGGSDACRPELQDDGSIVMKSIDSYTRAYRVTEETYRELREYPKLLVGMWSFVDETDEDAEYIASAHRSPSGAGHRIGRLERQADKHRALIETLLKAMTSAPDELSKVPVWVRDVLAPAVAAAKQELGQ